MPTARDPAALTPADFAFDFGSWTTRLPFPTCGAESTVSYAPEGRDDAPLEPHEIARVQWVADHERELFESVAASVVDWYPEEREAAVEASDGDLADELLPGIDDPRTVLALQSVFVHPLEADGLPFVGFEFNSMLDEEHGVGVLLHGMRVVEIGHADVAFTLWVAKRHSG